MLPDLLSNGEYQETHPKSQSGNPVKQCIAAVLVAVASSTVALNSYISHLIPVDSLMDR
jgi:hypothetical protein